MHLLSGALQVVSWSPTKLISLADSIYLVSLKCSSGYLEIFIGTFVAVCICTFRVFVLQFAHFCSITNCQSQSFDWQWDMTHHMGFGSIDTPKHFKGCRPFCDLSLLPCQTSAFALKAWSVFPNTESLSSMALTVSLVWRCNFARANHTFREYTRWLAKSSKPGSNQAELAHIPLLSLPPRPSHYLGISGWPLWNRESEQS